MAGKRLRRKKRRVKDGLEYQREREGRERQTDREETERSEGTPLVRVVSEQSQRFIKIDLINKESR